VAYEKVEYMCFTNIRQSQFLTRLALITATAVKGGQVEHSVQLYNITTLHCNEQSPLYLRRLHIPCITLRFEFLCP